MKKLALLLIASVTLLMCSSNQVREIRQYSIEQFYQNTNIRGGSFSPDETNLLITSNQTGIYNVFALPLDGTAPAQLTQSTGESNFAVSYLPNGDGFIYASDSGGDENDHLFWVNSEGNTTDLTPSEGAKSDFMQWSRDEKSMFFISNKRDPRFFDLYEMEMEGFGNPDAHRLVYQNDEGFDIGALSSNKRYLTLVKSITTSNNDLYLYDLQSRQLKHISPHDGDAQYNPQFFDLANENLYFLTNENDEYMYLASFNIAGGATEKVYGTNWDIWYAYTSYNEKYRIMGINEDAQTRIRITDLQTNQELVLPEIKGGSISSAGVSKSEKLMRLTVSTSSSPSNLYLYNMESKELTKLTNTLNPEIDPADLVEGEVIRYKSYDGLEIPAVYYRPLQAGVNSKVPGLVWVHGGPGGQSRLSYSALIQYLVNHGYAILAVNNRGSSGYGKTFNQMDDQKHGDVDLKDCIAAKDFLAGTGVVDMEKVGILGGSYGGYMVMAALTFAPDEFAVGVNIFGVTNWLRTLKSVPPYWESFRQALYTELGDPFSSDSTRLYNISPLFHADQVTKPLMVLQGANDPRVLQAESDEIVAAVKAKGVPVEYVLFPDEGHGFVKKENEIEGYGKIRAFLDQYLR